MSAWKPSWVYCKRLRVVGEGPCLPISLSSPNTVRVMATTAQLPHWWLTEINAEWGDFLWLTTPTAGKRGSCWPRSDCPESVNDVMHSDGLHGLPQHSIAGDGVLGQNQVHKTQETWVFSKIILCQSTAPSNHERHSALVPYISAFGQSTQPQGCATLEEAGTCPGILGGLDNTAHLRKGFLEP